MMLVGVHPFTPTSHFTVTGFLAILSFSIVLIVGFWRHGLHFFSLFVPHGTPWWLLWLIPVIELISFLVRPFSLALRLFVAMMAGHVLLEVLSSFVIGSANSGVLWGTVVGLPSFILMIAICALELLVAAESLTRPHPGAWQLTETGAERATGVFDAGALTALGVAIKAAEAFVRLLSRLEWSGAALRRA